MADPIEKLSDVLGGLVASMAHARAVADVQSLRIAYTYRSNEFLKGMPIPRLRFQRVTVNVPVILKSVLPGKAAIPAAPIDIVAKIRATLTSTLPKISEKVRRLASQQQLTVEEKRHFSQLSRLLEFFDPAVFCADLMTEIELALKMFGPGFQDQQGMSPDSQIRITTSEVVRLHIQRVLKEQAYLYVKARVELDRKEARKNNIIDDEQPRLDPERARNWFESTIAKNEEIVKLVEQLVATAEASAVAVSSEPPDFHISVNTADIKASGGGPDAVTTLSFVVREEGLEWHEESSEQGTVSRLIPE